MADNFEELAAALLREIDQRLPQWFPAGKVQGREFRIGNLRGDAGQSLAVNLDTGVWKDFAGGNGGKDLISLYAAIHNLKQGEAFKELGGKYSGKKAKFTAKEATYMPGHKCEKIPNHKRLGIPPVRIFDYFDATGKRIGHIARFEPPGMRKEFCPLTHWRNPDGSAYWAWKKWPGKSPLYRLPELLSNPDKKVLIVEGEGKCDHAQQIADLRDWIVVGWPGGAKGVPHVDWSPLQKREAWIWPDNDEDGIKAAQNIKAILPHLKIVKLPTDIPPKWDLGDAELNDPIASFIENTALQALSAPLPAEKENKQTLAECLDQINSEYAVIIHGSQVLIMRHWLGEDGQSKLTFFKERDFKSLQKNNIVYIEDDEGKVKKVFVADQWMEWKGRQQYEEVYFEPGGPEYKRRYNLWRGFAVQPSAKGKCDKFLDHLYKNVCQRNDEYFDWVFSWFADLFQKPTRKLGTSLVLRGPMGIGKGFLARTIGHLLGKHYMTITQGSQLTGKFNSHMADKLLMFIDESWWSDDRYGAGVLRALITEREVTIEMKGKDAVNIQNYTRFMIAANEKWVVPVSGADERRFSILDVGADEQQNKAYFSAIQSELDNGGYEALLHEFLTHEYDESLPGRILDTEALAENKLLSMSTEVAWWHECLLQEKIGDFILSSGMENDIECGEFYGAYLKWCEQMKRKPVTSHVLSRSLSDIIVNFNKTRKLSLKTSHMANFYQLQSLDMMRYHFEKAMGIKESWD